MATKSLSATNDVSEVVGHPQLAADAVFQILGTWSGTITFEAVTQGNEATTANWTPIAVSAAATPGTLVTTATANGLFKTKDAWGGGVLVRARLTTATSGTALVTATSSDY
jgi:hypothetical protein